jgi:glutathione S-transferase
MDVKEPKPRKLYDYLFSGNGYKIRLALGQLGIHVEYEILDILAGETRSPDFLLKNPSGQIPILELTDGTFLRESNAILYWLTEGTRLMPAEPLQRARVLQWMFFEQSNIDKVLGRARFMRTYPDFIKALPKGSMEMNDHLGNEALSVLDQHLRNRLFLVNDEYSAADICVFAYVHCSGDGGFNLGNYSAVHSWCESLKELPGHFPIDLDPR